MRVAPGADAERGLGKTDLQDVLELACGQCAQVAAMRDHAVGLRLQLLEQLPVVTARQVLEDVGFAGVRLNDRDPAVQTRHEVRVNEGLRRRAEAVEIVSEVGAVQRARRSGVWVKLVDLLGHLPLRVCSVILFLSHADGARSLSPGVDETIPYVKASP